MKKNRLEAFSDGVIAIIITIMVLEMKVPHGADLPALTPVLPVFLSYLLSFVYVGIYWNNHHHMFQVVTLVNGAVLWANLHLLFWLSLLPFTAGWMGENHFERWPTILYGLNLLFCALAYSILQTCTIRRRGPGSLLAEAWRRFQRQDLPGVVRSGHRLGMADPRLDRHGVFRDHGVDVAGARPAHGAGFRRTYEMESVILLMRAVHASRPPRR